MNNYSVLLYYKYVDFPEPEKFRNDHLQFCLDNDIKGRVYISSEGINGTVSGTIENVEKYKSALISYHEFSDMIFKEDPAGEHAFFKMHVRVKDEIVHADFGKVDLENTGRRLKPEELLKMYEEEDDFVIIDARNGYESDIGRFKNAVAPEMETFRDWPRVVQELETYKEKKVVTYCTGGIRCEKASALLVEKGFKNVYQLDGGIVSYTKKFPDTFWEGSVFVFDERRIVSPNTIAGMKHIAKCYYCGEAASWYFNCHNQNCDKLFVTCDSCKVEHEYCCSDECRNSTNKRKRFHG
ncbi:MAG: rhodanese-related sulfurtransferase [Melioribacteraceae bacterium]|nr:rhodanese-related sulfurtransferase [Melioribacteraceae bacterium]MCF8353817.1 rhodanese-related sulfurtransferase [Melioribacteraceae bacterium]MCF8393653.1 rhodanese-related sulfurtransferase [Melioribacteraceae bacterium]MCF8419463.1 rhodanese-related sulfurtransferase [Melioribacteraceae bacterium]